MTMTSDSELNSLRDFYNSGATRSFAFRKEQLLKLKRLIASNESEIAAALKQDLGKSEEEAYATETGLLLSEISYALSNLSKWMSPVSVKTTLANFPSSSKIYRDPLGVVLVIGTWNYPFQLVMMPALAAIAAGNCVVVKPSEMAPVTAGLIEKLIVENFADNYIRVVQGPGEEVIPPMINSFRFDHIFYTGSTTVGRRIYELAASQLIPVTLELGGKSPVVVAPDADLVATARRISLGKWLNAGQTCIAPDYVLVHESVRSGLLQAISESIEDFYTKDPSTSHDYGRIINAARFQKVISYLADGHVVYGGRHDAETLYIGPTILEDVQLDAPIMQEEIFGPLLPVISYRDTDEAMAIIQRNPDPLAFYLFTRSDKLADEWIAKTSFGGGCINNTGYHFTNYHLPFGGVRASGMGSYHGKFGFDIFSRPKPVMTTPFWFDPRLKYPSFKGKIKLLKRMFK
jgi:aldehyde dehydrogenase (NAD+)